ncbi:hypothetical protein G6F56_014568 [Rhizopus delemar]|nr:hypothetical protein G6F56_014568 [Rhizopus delemar]
MWRIAAGTPEIPTPAATRLTMDAICGASWITRGANPARWQADWRASYSPAPMGRGYSTKSWSASAAMGTLARRLKGWSGGRATSIGSSSTRSDSNSASNR